MLDGEVSVANVLLHTSDALAVHSVDILQARDDVVLDAEGDPYLVVGTLLEYEGALLHVVQFLLAVEGVYDVTFGAVFEDYSHLFDHHSTRVIRGLFVIINRNARLNKRKGSIRAA